MKKRIISLAVVLIVAAGLLGGCTVSPRSQDGYQHGNSSSNAITHDEGTDTGNGYGNGGHGSADSRLRGNGNGGNGNGQRAGTGDGVCIPAEAYEPAVTFAPESENNETDITVVTGYYGASGAIADEELTLAKMLVYAIQDEYRAHAEYAYIIDTFGSTRSFSNIIKAEGQHIEALLLLLNEYGIHAPADTGSDHTVMVSSLTEAFQAGVKAEGDNIAMYDEFLMQHLPNDVRSVFESLRNASENHLATFQNHL